MPVNYVDGTRIQVGDAVTDDGEPGQVVLIILDGEALPPYRAEDWAYLGKGIGVLSADGELVVMGQADEHLIPAAPKGGR